MASRVFLGEHQNQHLNYRLQHSFKQPLQRLLQIHLQLLDWAEAAAKQLYYRNF